MKSYPSISKEVNTNTYIYAFDKLDGSNIRAEWNLKQGFYKFGTRTQLIDETSQFGKAIALIKNKYEENLTSIFKQKSWKSVICFFEFYGPSSFAGQHKNDEDQTVTLIDCNPYKEGILPPEQFINLFKHLDIPKVLFEGYVDLNLINKVKSSLLEGMTFEGCVCKGGSKHELCMFKIKSQSWLNKLKDYCKDDEVLYNRLM